MSDKLKAKGPKRQADIAQMFKKKDPVAASTSKAVAVATPGENREEAAGTNINGKRKKGEDQDEGRNSDSTMMEPEDEDVEMISGVEGLLTPVVSASLSRPADTGLITVERLSKF